MQTSGFPEVTGSKTATFAPKPEAKPEATGSKTRSEPEAKPEVSDQSSQSMTRLSNREQRDFAGYNGIT